ncbi:MAG: carboxylating nicotinate-nucleotide diphosphorylase [Calditerrivibrio sp.]|nr:carboxylating nicotinate-nucleotide diphosphorylase [Calditerrivibrio sp.]MCA1932831.1 carboxylating nicotinate-nucleotide diphosphorylase [Calditerrivibrio sp.]
MINCELIDRLIELSIHEDIGRGDLSSIAIEDYLEDGEFHFIAKEEFVLCGTEVAKKVFEKIDQNLSVNFFKNDGELLSAGEIFGKVVGYVGSILSGERIALNFLQRLSGIATNTKKYIEKLSDSDIKIIDTRKTIPGHRILEKYAVTVGGGSNHRFGLFDGVMLKDNHIDAVGSIKKAVEIARKKTPITVKIEVETRNIKEVIEALEAGADIIMLDNFSIKDIKEAISIVKKKVKLEVSGGINIENLDLYKKLKIDYISIGALTHQAKSVDMSLKFRGKV